ncbi:unnamed protein product [Parnassius mnemosyne]|uniref:THAP-type domain-containing protein n=1 Tax=Parnassius mnemosyne TaxID=213953 RepID=A0AAV1KGM2_9NEOP
MWIDATCRGDGWFPTKNSVLCSRHFTEDNLHIMKKRRRLLDSAIPSLYLPVLAPIPTIGSSADIAAKNSEIPVAGTSLKKRYDYKNN